MENLLIRYQSQPVHFETNDSDVKVNVTEFAKMFPDKNLSTIINSKEIKEYVEKLSEIGNFSSADLLEVRKGGDVSKQGTWANRKVALRIAQKLSPEFAIMVDTEIERIMYINAAVRQSVSPAIDYSSQIATIADTTDRMMANLQLILNRMDRFMERITQRIELPEPKQIPEINPVLIKKTFRNPTEVKPSRDLNRDKVLMFCFRQANTMDENRGRFRFEMKLAEAETQLSAAAIRSTLEYLANEQVIEYNDMGETGEVMVKSIKPLTKAEIQIQQRSADSFFNKIFRRSKKS